MHSSAGKRVTRVVIAGSAALVLAVCVAGPWELGRAARHAQARDACETMRSLEQSLSDNMRAMATSIRGFEQENRRRAATWRGIGAESPELHSGGDDVLLQISADLAANNERLADQEEHLAIDIDRRAAEARVGTPCERSGL